MAPEADTLLVFLISPDGKHYRARESRQHCLRKDAEKVSVKCEIDQIARQD